MEISERHGLANRGHKGTGTRKLGKENVEKKKVELFIILGQTVKGNEVGKVLRWKFQARFGVCGCEKWVKKV